MVSLCGLALSSFFVINNQKLVHADSFDNGAAAMSFDDNSASNNSAIKADDSVQNKSAVGDGNTNNAQNLQSSNLNCEQKNNNSAQVHYNADGVQSINPAQNNNVKVANVNDAASVQLIVIDNPVNNQVHVHFVTTNGQSIDQNSHDYNIDINQSGQGRYQVPANYQLANGNGVYSTQYVSNKMPTFAYSGSMSWDLQPDGNAWGHNASGGSVDFTKDESQWLFDHGVTANAAVMPAKTGIIYDLGDGSNNDRTFKFVGVKITRNDPDENHPDGSYDVNISNQGPTVKPGQTRLVPDSYIYGPGKELPLNLDHADMKTVLKQLDYAYHIGILPIDAQEADRIFTPAMGKDFKTLPNYDSREAVQEQLGKTLQELLHTGRAGKVDAENLAPIVGGDWRGREDAPFDLSDYDQVDSKYPWEYTETFDMPEINLSFYKPDEQHVGTHEDYDAQTMNGALNKTKSFVHANPNLFEGSIKQLEANLDDQIKSNDQMAKLFDFQAHPFGIDQDVANPETKINNLGNDLVKSNQAEDDLDK